MTATLAGMEIRPASDDDLAAMSELASLLQADPARAIPYLGVEAGAIEKEMTEVDWSSVSALALDGDRLAGWLVGDVDDELGRVFWLGPFLDAARWDEVADLLYAGCAKSLPTAIAEEEMAIDSRFDQFQRWATSRGFVPGVGSLALVLEADPEPAGVEVRHVRDDDLATLGALHEQLFPGTHTTGRRLVEDRDEDHLRLVVEVDGSLAGYVAFDHQADGSGYLDFLGVAPEFRRRGLATALVRSAIATLQGRGAAPIHLTVREDNHGARSLYASSGFTETRLIRPLRKGFTLP